MLAVPPTQLPLKAASGCQPSTGGKRCRNNRKAVTKAMNRLTLVQANTASTRGPSARIARRSQFTINRNSRAGTRCETSVFCAVWISLLDCHSPDTASAVTSR